VIRKRPDSENSGREDKQFIGNLLNISRRGKRTHSCHTRNLFGRSREKFLATDGSGQLIAQHWSLLFLFLPLFPEKDPLSFFFCFLLFCPFDFLSCFGNKIDGFSPWSAHSQDTYRVNHDDPLSTYDPKKNKKSRSKRERIPQDLARQDFKQITILNNFFLRLLIPADGYKSGSFAFGPPWRKTRRRLFWWWWNATCIVDLLERGRPTESSPDHHQHLTHNRPHSRYIRDVVMLCSLHAWFLFFCCAL